MRIDSVVGARPQFVKLAPLCQAFDGAGGSEVDHRVIHTGQHYDYEMSKAFFDELGIPKPDYNLSIGSETHGKQTGEMLKRLEEVLLAEQPDVVLVYGDTNSTLAGALAAAKLRIPVGHVESGLRSYRKGMPEEINRVLTDHVSTLLFCPTATATQNLRREGFGQPFRSGELIGLEFEDFPLAATADTPWVLNVGDVMRDSVLRNVALARSSAVLNTLGISSKTFAVATIHRAENTDDSDRLGAIIRALEMLSSRELPVIAPLHPRSEEAMARFGIDRDQSFVRWIPPVSYPDMLCLVSNAKLVLTDSGGLQKEAYMLGTPCVTLRDETEWGELVDVGWNRLAGADEQRIVSIARQSLSALPHTSKTTLYGDGHAAERIVHVVQEWRARVQA